MRAALYLRQSRDALQNGLAVERQRQDCEKLAAERGWTITATLTDNDLSASNGKTRPDYERLLRMVDDHAIDVIVAYHVDRLTRRLADLEHLIQRCEKAGVRVATVSGDIDLSTDAGRLVGRILGSVAAGEVERKSARQKRAALQAAESGKPPSRRAFGFTNGDHDPIEAPALQELYRLVLAGMSMLAATRWLNERGHVTTTGKVWDRSSTRKMLLNPRNAGLRAHNGTVVAQGQWQPIIDEATWRAVVELVADPSRRREPVGGRWLGSGLFRCWCGARCRVNYSHHHSRVYQCKAHSHLSRNAEPIEEVVIAAIVARLRQPDLAGLLATETNADVPALRDQAAAERLRLDQVAADYAEGLLTGRQVQIATDKITARLESTEQALTEAGRGARLGPLISAPDPGQAWLDADLDIRRTVLDTLATVTILPGAMGRVPFDPESVRIEWKGDGST
ncbi:MAG: recombinase family protein [Nocardioidaceae bacterium]